PRPALALADGGFPVGRAASATWRAQSKRWDDGCPLPPQPAAGERISNLDLSATFAAVAEGGRDAHYEGGFAKAAVAAVDVLTTDDLARHRGEWVEPISATYRGRQVLELPPNGQGAAVVVALSELEAESGGERRDPATVTRTMTAVRRGMQAALANVGDPRTVTVPPFWEGRDTVYTAVVADGMAVSLISSVFMP